MKNNADSCFDTTQLENTNLNGTHPDSISNSAAATILPRALMWFRRDLRMEDNTALILLCDLIYHTAQPLDSQTKAQFPTLSAVFVATPKQWLQHDMSLVQLDFIFRTLKVLANDLYQKLNIRLQLLVCDSYAQSVTLLKNYCQTNAITHVMANAEYEVNEIKRDQQLAQRLAQLGIQFDTHQDQCILPPGTVTTGEDKMYQVFTPFYKRWQQILETSTTTLYQLPDSHCEHIKMVNALNAHDFQLINATQPASGSQLEKTTQYAKSNQQPLADLLSQIEQQHQQVLRLFIDHYAAKGYDNDSQQQLAFCNAAYPAGESAAYQRLAQFIKEDIHDYQVSRDQPAFMATSQLSAYLTIGAMSARQCYQQATATLQQAHSQSDSGRESRSADILTWIKELAWRDFYRHVIADRPDIVTHNAYKKDIDDKINWSYDLNDFKAWREGMTGVPLVDAAMRCLNQTGFMHNRLRMVTAMFLTKDLLIDWRWGERYFMQQLIDGDFASNNGGWQWSASVGTDAAPYFRIMNPFSQAKTHDKSALFIKTWLPELKDIPASILHDEAKLRQALTTEGRFAAINYPAPMVEHKRARLYAIEQFKAKD